MSAAGGRAAEVPVFVARAAAVAALGCAALAVALPVLAALFWGAAPAPGAGIAGVPIGFPAGAADRMGGFALTMAPAAIGMLALARLGAVFRWVAGGAALGPEAAARVQRLAAAVLLCPAALILARAGLSLWATRDAAPGEHALAITLSGGDLLLLLAGLLLLGLAAALRRAAAIADELRQIV